MLATCFFIQSNKYEKSIIVEKKSQYKILCLNNFYYFCVLDENNKTVKFDGPFTKKPEVMLINDNIIKFTLQAGTGLGTQWGYYYDLEKNQCSKVFPSIYDQYDSLVAYGGSEKIIISDMFNRQKVCIEIKNFSHPLSKVAEPILNANFIEGGSKIRVLYLTGDNYLKTSEVFSVNNKMTNQGYNIGDGSGDQSGDGSMIEP